MFPSVSDTDKNSKLRWQKSQRRISSVKLPLIRTKHVIKQTGAPSDESIPPDPCPSTSTSAVRTIIPSLCIDNRYFSNYLNEKSSVYPTNDVNYMTKAFQSFAKIHGELNAKRRNYFEKRGLEDAIQLNINQQNDRIGQAIECLNVCEQITQKYNCSLNNSFHILIDEFATKCFKLSSISSQLYALRQTHNANLLIKEKELLRTADLEWRIEREVRRIAELDDRILEFNVNEPDQNNEENIKNDIITENINKIN